MFISPLCALHWMDVKWRSETREQGLQLVLMSGSLYAEWALYPVEVIAFKVVVIAPPWSQWMLFLFPELWVRFGFCKFCSFSDVLTSSAAASMLWERWEWTKTVFAERTDVVQLCLPLHHGKWRIQCFLESGRFGLACFNCDNSPSLLSSFL